MILRNFICMKRLFLFFLLFPLLAKPQIIVGDTSSAGIIYKNIKDSTIAMVLKSVNYADFDIDNDNNLDIRFQVYQNYSPGFTALDYSAIALTTNLDFIALSSDNGCVDSSAVGDVIDNNTPWYTNTGAMYLYYTFYSMGVTTYRGVYKSSRNYLAFRKVSPTDTTYGWFLLSRASNITLRSWAYKNRCSSVSPLTTTSASSLICSNESATLSVSGADTYTWSTGENSYSIAVTPSITSSYSVTGTVNNCTVNAVITQSVDACIGIKEYSAEKIYLYPNPVNEILNISVPSSNAVEIIITNLLGKVKFEKEYCERINLSFLAAGPYFIMVRSSERTILKEKFIKLPD
jgi:hypothetical protein